MSEQPEILVYGNNSCPYCGAARMLLTKKGAKYTDVPVGNDPEKFEEMMQRSGRRTVPQIFIGDRHIGGFDDLYALDQQGGLDPLLGATTESND